MVSFNDIRKIGTNQEDGFEEFVCQLARKENIYNSKKFVRIGNPDGGLECYWELNDGSVIGWQAKFFTTSLSYSNRWNQIKNSIKSSLKNYNLKKIIIAIPYDLAKIDARDLESKISEWKNLPEANGKEFEIEFWWKHDLITRLQKPENKGFYKFWFNKLEFTDEWFKNQAKKSIENLGDKYSRVLNIETNNKIYFDSVCRNDEFKKYFYEKTHPPFLSINKSIKAIDSCFEKVSSKPNNLFNFKYSFEQLKIEILKLDFEDYETFDLKGIFNLIKECKNKLNFKLTFLNNSTQKTFQHALNNMNDNLIELKEFLNRDEIKITNNPMILFYGDAGMGKSFLFGDIAETKIKNNESVVLLLGQQFGRLKNPENIIVEELGISNNYNFDDFLDALECKSYIDKSRIMIMIDALDDGKGPDLWNRYLPGFFDEISKRRRISFIFSIRTTFLNDEKEQNPYKLTIPQSSNIIKIKITGFKDNYNARIGFFEHYKIQLSNKYMLSPELNNPLFLKIFCESLNNYGFHEIPNDFEGFSTIMNLYISSINLKLAHECKYYPDINLVNEVLIKLIEYDIKNQDEIPIEKANTIIITTLNAYPFRHIFLQKLLEEGILIKVPGSNNNLIINVTFQRFKDYIIAKHYVNSLNMNQFLEFLKELLNNSTPYNKRILDMLSIYLPEKFDIEIYELLDDDLKVDFELVDSFIQSLKWRRNSINEKVFEFINKYILKDHSASQTFLETLISLAPIEKHLFNSYRTHKMLKQLNLSERDGFWTTFLHDQTHENSEVNNLLTFAFLENHEYYSDESLKLASIMIAWFLSTTNKKLRDKSTYALVNLLKNKLNILKELLQLFEDVDDPYILERLYAAAYGCILNSKNYENLGDLSNYIYEAIFNQEIVYPHVLIRDYARNIIEFSLSKNCELNDEISIVKEKISPPYSSKFPEIPSDEDVEKYKTGNNAVERIFNSMRVEYDRNGKSLMYGYFGRYTFQSYFSMWEKVLRENNIYFMDLMNIALDKIFKLNYNEESHGYFDEYVVGLYNHEEFTECIGKKYQWIVLYELLAQVSDKFPIIYSDYISNEKNIPYQGPWQDNIRNIDPTITCTNLPKINWDLEEKYPPEHFLNDEWLGNIQDLPDFSKIIESNIGIGEIQVNGLILEGYLTWIKQHDFGQDEYPKKEIWSQIRSYIVENNDFNKIVPILRHENFDGRWMPESHENYELFNKEFYQSIAFDYFYDNGWNGKYELNLNNNKYSVDVATSKYSGSERSDLVNNDYMKINKSIFDKLDLKYGDENSFIYDKSNNLVGFDTSEFDNVQDTALIFNKEILLDYLKENNLKIFFTVLGEKMIINRGGINSKIQTFSGVYSFNGNENINGDIKHYSKCYFEELETSVAGIVKEIETDMNNTFKKKSYVDYANKISYLFIETKIKEFNAKKEIITNETIESYEWNIYSLDKNKIGKKYLKFISSQIGEIGDSYLVYCEINEKFYNIIVTSAFEERNSNRSKLYQQFIKPLLLNMKIRLKSIHYFGNYDNHPSCKLFVPEDVEDEINKLLSLMENNGELI